MDNDTALSQHDRRLNDTQLRVVYTVLALFSLGWIVVTSYHTLLERPQSDECYWDIAGSGNAARLVVDSVKAGGAADRAGVLVGDTVLAINGTAVTGPASALSQRAQRMLNTAPAGIPISYVVSRNGGVHDLFIVLVKDERPGRELQHIVPLGFSLFSFLWLVIGTLVVMVQPSGRLHRSFFLTAATAAFAFTIPGGRGDLGHDPVGLATQLLLASCFVSFWLHFCSQFPNDQRLFRNRYGKAVLLVPPAFMAISIVFGIAVDITTPGGPGALASFVIMVALAIFVAVLFFLGGVVLMYRGYHRLAPSVDRRPMRAILVGSTLTIVALLALPFLVIFPALGLEVGVPMIITLALMMGLPVSFGFAIFKYQVMSFRLVVRTTLVYMLTMTLVGGIYLGAAFGVSRLLGAVVGEMTGAIGAGIFVLCLLLFDPLKRELQARIENRFFPKHRDYSAHLAEYSASIERRMAVQDVASLIAGTLQSTLEITGVAVVLERDGAVEIAAQLGCDQQIEVHELAAVADLMRCCPGLMALEVQGGEELAALSQRYPYAVALSTHGHINGFALIARPSSGEAFSDRQLQFIGTVAMQGGSALEVARLYEEELARQRYQEQLAAARHIQQSLLTSELPELPGLSVGVAARSALAVGGDYFKVMRLDDARVLVVVADVSGKGLPASLYMAQLHGMVCIAGSASDSPTDVLTTINDHLYAEMARGTFVTATVMLFDVERGIVHYARAGHTPLLLHTENGLRKLTPRGLPLGIVPRREFLRHLEERSVMYAPGDTFVLYSDGLTEAMNESLEEYGDDRLLALLHAPSQETPDELCDRILADVENFRAGADQNDDVTMVVIRTGDVVAERDAVIAESVGLEL